VVLVDEIPLHMGRERDRAAKADRAEPQKVADELAQWRQAMRVRPWHGAILAQMDTRVRPPVPVRYVTILPLDRTLCPDRAS
jgi:hypothetical protein